MRPEEMRPLTAEDLAAEGARDRDILGDAYPTVEQVTAEMDLSVPADTPGLKALILRLGPGVIKARPAGPDPAPRSGPRPAGA